MNLVSEEVVRNSRNGGLPLMHQTTATATMYSVSPWATKVTRLQTAVQTEPRMPKKSQSTRPVGLRTRRIITRTGYEYDGEDEVLSVGGIARNCA